MSQTSDQSVSATPESEKSDIYTSRRGKLIQPRDFIYHTPGNSPVSTASVVASSSPPSPDISWVFRPVNQAPVKSSDPGPLPISSPVVDACRILKFPKPRVVKKPFRKNFKNGIFKVLKKIDPNGTISSKGMNVMNDLVCDLFERIAISSQEFSKKSGKQTLTVRDILSGVRVLLPGQLGGHAYNEGWKALKRSHEFDTAAKRARD